MDLRLMLSPKADVCLAVSKCVTKPARLLVLPERPVSCFSQPQPTKVLNPTNQLFGRVCKQPAAMFIPRRSRDPRAIRSLTPLRSLLGCASAPQLKAVRAGRRLWRRGARARNMRSKSTIPSQYYK